MYQGLMLPDIREMIAEGDTRGLKEFCESLYPVVAAEVLTGLSGEEAWKVLANCSVPRQAEIFSHMSLPDQISLVNAIPRQPLSTLIEAMAPDDRVDLLERLEPTQVENILPLIAQAERSDVRKLLSYPETSAGSIMTTEYASLPEDITVGEAFERLRRQAPDRETIYYVYIVDLGRRLRGVVTLRQLILAKPVTKLADIMNQQVISVRVDDDQEVAARELARFDFLAIPVVDNQNQLVGIITHDDVLDVLEDEATEDAHLQGAVQPLEDGYLSTPLKTITWKRGVWLIVLLGTAFASAAILRAYDKVIAQYEWLVLFIPMVLASGGNAGSQSATLIIRALAVGQVSSVPFWTIVRRELTVAMILGTFLMLAGGGLAHIFVPTHQAMIVGVTVFLVVIMGTLAGGMLPLLFKRLGMDPALMSNPLISALVDVTGVVIYFSVAIWMMRT